MTEDTDRELLELAARAAGIERGADRLDCELSITKPDGRHESLPQWNPLASDADALRLAVKLGLGISHVIDDNPEPFVNVGRIRNERLIEVYETDYADPYAATRRAIVRAAAALARKDAA